MRRISNSEIWGFKRCRRRWYLSQYRRLKPVKKTEKLGVPATTGNAIHEALQTYYSPETPFDQDSAFWAMYAYLDKLEQEHSVEQLDAINESRSFGQRMLEGYFEWLAETGADVGLAVESAESIVGVEIEGVVLSGKMDTRLINEHTGGRMPMDHKTVGSFNEMKRDIQMNEQLLTYILIDHLTKEEGERVDGGMLNMLRRVKRTAAAKPPFYDRATVTHGVEMMRNFWYRIVGEIQEIKRTEERLNSGESHITACPPTPDKSCAWQCDFYRVCALLDSAPVSAETRLSLEFEEHDPYQRYQEVTISPAVHKKGEE